VTVSVGTGNQGWRRRDLDREYFPFVKDIGEQIGLVDLGAHQKLGSNDALAPNETDKQRQISHYYTM
jgi:hypothetical protein